MATVYVDPIRKSDGYRGWTVTVVKPMEVRELRFKGKGARKRALAAAAEFAGRLVVAP